MTKINKKRPRMAHLKKLRCKIWIGLDPGSPWVFQKRFSDSWTTSKPTGWSWTRTGSLSRTDPKNVESGWLDPVFSKAPSTSAGRALHKAVSSTRPWSMIILFVGTATQLVILPPPPHTSHEKGKEVVICCYITPWSVQWPHHFYFKWEGWELWAIL